MEAQATFTKKKRLEIDAELNIVSIIDCFTVIIIYLITAASFLSIGALDSEIARAGAGSPAAAPVTHLNLVAELKPGHEISLGFLGNADAKVVIPANAAGRPDYERAAEKIREFKRADARMEKVVLLADNEVKYAELVAAAYALGKVSPIVLTAGDTQ